MCDVFRDIQSPIRMETNGFAERTQALVAREALEKGSKQPGEGYLCFSVFHFHPSLSYSERSSCASGEILDILDHSGILTFMNMPSPIILQ